MRRFLLSLAFVAAASPAFAADDAPATDMTPPVPPCMKDGAAVPDDYVQLARDVMIASKANERMTQILDAMLPALMDIARKNEHSLSDDDMRAFMAVARDEMVKALPQLINANACLYVEHFSREELTGMIAWYRSPLGQKVIAENPAIVKEALPLGRAWGEQAARAAIAHVIASHRNKGDKT